MKKLYTIFALILFVNLNLGATKQIPDIIILNDDTLEFRDAPITYDIYRDKDSCLSLENLSLSSSCWDKLYNVWIVNNDSLFIKDIKTCDGDRSLFKEYLLCKKHDSTNSLIFANEIKGEFWCTFGEYVEIDIYGPLYRKNESCLFFENGILKEKTDFLAKENYEPNTISKYISELIYKNVNWELVSNEMIVNLTVSFGLFINENGNAELRGFQDLYLDKELKEEFKKIIISKGKWNKYYFYGKPMFQRHYIEIYFDNEIMKSYAR